MTATNIDQISTPIVTKVIRAQGIHEGEKYLFERVQFNNGLISERIFVLTPGGWEETIFIPDNDNNVTFELDLSHLSQDTLSVINSSTGSAVSCLDRIEPFTLGNSLNVIIRAKDKEKWTEERKRLEILEPTPDDIEYLFSRERSSSIISLKDINEFVNQLEEKKHAVVKRAFFKGIDDEFEFGVSRLMADRVYLLPKLLDKLKLEEMSIANSYKLSAHENTSTGRVALEYFFDASNGDEAQKIAEIFKRKITGVGERLWLACWDFANTAISWTFEVDTIDLYRKCYPCRESHPNGEERREFFNLIRFLERPKFSLTRKKKNKPPTTYELPIIRIFSFDGCADTNGWPRRLKLQVIPPNALEDNMAFVAAPFHRNTLNLDHSDTQLATMLQVRRSQCKGADCISFTLEDLIRGAGLQATAQNRLSQAKKLLIAKLERLKVIGIVKSYPSQMPACVNDKIMIKFPNRKSESELSDKRKLGV